uniref:GrpE protein homolog, mitochondrial n=1 Tax=Lepeophtheirus salmonis TaxID=72036 RepID=C1BTK9_LEPSM|nr:GrpE protein homolog, mitochondrial precursor [Lepeophtheirus salmonis]
MATVIPSLLQRSGRLCGGRSSLLRSSLALSFNTSDSKDVEEATESPEIFKLREEIEELRGKNVDLLDKYRRSIAENENMRQRLTKQINDAKIFGIQSFCKDLLDVSDVLSKAVETLPEDASKDIRDGIKLTESQLLQVFTRHGLVKENPLNEKFDPNKHEAAFQIPAPKGVEDNIVLDVQKVGFILQGRTIRPAVVGVSKK